MALSLPGVNAQSVQKYSAEVKVLVLHVADLGSILGITEFTRSDPSTELGVYPEHDHVCAPPRSHAQQIKKNEDC